MVPTNYAAVVEAIANDNRRAPGVERSSVYPGIGMALICILAVGIGPFAGILALGLHTAGVLGKL